MAHCRVEKDDEYFGGLRSPRHTRVTRTRILHPCRQRSLVSVCLGTSCPIQRHRESELSQEDLHEMAHTRMVLRAAQEPSIRAWCRQQVAGLVRTLREHVQFHAGVEIPAKHPMMAWIVGHAGAMLSPFSWVRDGLTPYDRLKGVLRWHRFRRTRHKLEARWGPGVYLGVRSTSEKIIGDEHGIFVVQSIRRVDEGSKMGQRSCVVRQGHAMAAQRTRRS